MYCSVRRYRTDPGQMDELMHRIDEGFCEQLERGPGFVAYQALDCGDGTASRSRPSATGKARRARSRSRRRSCAIA